MNWLFIRCLALHKIRDFKKSLFVPLEIRLNWIVSVKSYPFRCHMETIRYVIFVVAKLDHDSRAADEIEDSSEVRNFANCFWVSSSI